MKTIYHRAPAEADTQFWVSSCAPGEPAECADQQPCASASTRATWA